MLENGFYHLDCMQGMKEFPDKYFDLAIVDPPYGNGNDDYDATKQRYGGRFQRYKKDNNRDVADWDKAPSKEYFSELFRISKNQVIWGGNYFNLPPTRCFIVWEKLTISEQFSMAMCEYAWTSFNSVAKIFKHAPQGKKGDERFHPTQKPIALYEWILSKYAKDGDLILDTHVGSGSSLIACHNMGFKYVGFEIDDYYYQKAKERLDNETAQMNIFSFMEQKGGV